MFAIAHDLWMYPDHRSDPKLERLWAADTSGATHQIPNDSSHGLHRAGGSGQLQMGMLTIGSELIGPSQKFSNHHADTTRTARLTQQRFHTLKDSLELGTIGKLQRLAGKLVESLTHVFACDFSLSPSPAALQLADKVKMTQLQDPVFVHGQRGNAPNLVGDQGANAFVRSYGNCADGLRPTTDFLPTRKKQRIQEQSAVLVTGLQAHQVQHPRTSVEAKVKAIDQKHQWPWQIENSAVGDQPQHSLMETVAQCPLRKTTVIPCKIFQSPAFQENRSQQSGRRSPRMPTSFFLPHPPGALAVAALATSRAETVHSCLTTTRLRVQCLHARELCIYSRPK